MCDIDLVAEESMCVVAAVAFHSRASLNNFCDRQVFLMAIKTCRKKSELKLEDGKP